MRWLAIRPEDRRTLVVGFFSLMLIMMSHAMLETARDALFLSRLPATKLPWAYLVIAVLAVIELRALNRLMVRFSDRRRLLSLTLVSASLVTFAFWWWLDDPSATSVGALYAWTGLFVTVALVQLWLLLGDSVTVTQAKRVFGPITAGGVAGAVLGSFVADRLVAAMSTRPLLLVSCALLLAAAALPMSLAKPSRQGDPERVQDGPLASRSDVRALFGQPYLRSLFLLVLLGTVALTGADFVFKTIVSEQILIQNLGAFFARFYLVLNLVSLGVQVLLATRILQSFGVHRAISILPLFLCVGLVGTALAPVLLAALAMKTIDGGLRHSLYKTGQEVLYLPLTNRVRSRAKTLIDAFGYRGGQALASAIILAALGMGASTTMIAWGLAAICLVWVATIASMQTGYLDLFRTRLKLRAIETSAERRELDLHSLEALLASLNSEDDEEVIAAIDLFAVHGKAELLPVLLLYHPSKEVTLRTFEVLAVNDDARLAPVARRLLKSDDEDIRIAALRALNVVEPSRALLNKHLRGDSPAVQATALVGLMGLDGVTPEHRAQLDRWIEVGSAETAIGLARAMKELPQAVFTDVLIRLTEHRDARVRHEAVRAMAFRPDVVMLPHLLPFLASTEARACARRAMLGIGEPAVAFLAEKLEDPSVERKVRRHIPRTLSRFDPKLVAPILLDHMATEEDGAIRYKTLRGLGRIVANNPKLALDNKRLDALTKSALRRALTAEQWRRLAASRVQTDSWSGSLLLATLKEKRDHAVERAFRLLGLRYRREDFALIWRGLRADNNKVRSASRELLDGALAGSFREAVLALIDEDTNQDRLTRASRSLGDSNAVTTYEDALVAMLSDHSDAVRCIAAYHIAEQGLEEMIDDLQKARPDDDGWVRDAIDKALHVLSTPPPAKGVTRAV